MIKQGGLPRAVWKQHEHSRKSGEAAQPGQAAQAAQSSAKCGQSGESANARKEKAASNGSHTPVRAAVSPTVAGSVARARAPAAAAQSGSASAASNALYPLSGKYPLAAPQLLAVPNPPKASAPSASSAAREAASNPMEKSEAGSTRTSMVCTPASRVHAAAFTVVGRLCSAQLASEKPTSDLGASPVSSPGTELALVEQAEAELARRGSGAPAPSSPPAPPPAGLLRRLKRVPSLASERTRESGEWKPGNGIATTLAYALDPCAPPAQPLAGPETSFFKR
ncbi:hypothetical protein T492DRAFT_834088 [Pavlovales sp. CCMP2436]|nr:hypothetical protein T492DRAFT_834088 [Pavlovales sp. CCMP2436]